MKNTKTIETPATAKGNPDNETAHTACSKCGKLASQLKGEHKGRAMRSHEKACKGGANVRPLRKSVGNLAGTQDWYLVAGPKGQTPVREADLAGREAVAGPYESKAQALCERTAPAKAPAKSATKPVSAPAKGKTTKGATKTKSAPKGKAASAGVPRAFSKTAIIAELIGRKGGATLAEIMSATDWQAHSVRGFLSTYGKTHAVASTKSDAGERTYTLQGVK